jgi:hypothetical protein
MTIWVDQDGVLADFDLEYMRRFGKPCPGIHAEGSTEKEKWDNVRKAGDFFLYMPWMPDGREMWSLLKPTGAHILTAVPKSIAECPGHKMEWCKRELGIGTDRIVYAIGKKNKVLYCQPGDVLLDDNPDTIRMWNEAGGVGLLITPNHTVDAAIAAVGLWRKFKA